MMSIWVRTHNYWNIFINLEQNAHTKQLEDLNTCLS